MILQSYHQNHVFQPPLHEDLETHTVLNGYISTNHDFEYGLSLPIMIIVLYLLKLKSQ